MRRFRSPAFRHPSIRSTPFGRGASQARSGGALIALAVTGLLAGCAAPPALMIASQAVDGVSYLTTGKSSTDHLLSAALNEDCALHRVISGVAVCHVEHRGTEPETPVQTASLDGSAVAGDDAFVEPEYAAPASATRAGPETESAAVAALPAAGRGLGADMFFVPHEGAGEAARAVPEDRPSPSDSAAPEGDVAATRTSTGQWRYFVVLGTFTRKENAARTARAFGDGVRVAETREAGGVYYRVVVGPFDGDAGNAARERYVRSGYADAWSAAACTSSQMQGCIPDE